LCLDVRTAALLVQCTLVFGKGTLMMACVRWARVCASLARTRCLVEASTQWLPKVFNSRAILHKMNTILVLKNLNFELKKKKKNKNNFYWDG